MRIHQITQTISFGDAISNHIYEMDLRFQKWGYESHIFVQRPYPVKHHRLASFDELGAFLDDPNDLFIFHYGVYHPGVELFQRAKGRKIVVYHNITPAHYYHHWDFFKENICKIGRTYLSSLADCDLAIGVSDYNRQELIQAGFTENKTAVLPIFLTLDTFESLPINEHLAQKLSQLHKTNWLTVGRIAPHKGIHNVIRIFYIYHTYLNPESHLYLVGSDSMANYKEALVKLIQELELSQHITFTGKVSDAEFKTYYSSADLYITASEHEGFCVPLIESMYFNLPILAKNSSAVPETLADAGILFSDLGYEEVASMAHLMLTNSQLNQHILSAQQKRLETFSPEHVESSLHEIIKQFE